MYPAKFDYHRATSVAEAVKLLQDNEDAKLLAGGHSLIPAMKLRLAQPSLLVDIGRIPALNEIRESNESIHIGALTTHANLAASEVLRKKCPLLAEAASHVGDQQVRNKGTIGGNLVHADPASDLPAAILAMGATLHATGPNGDRKIKAADFFVDLLATDLQPTEILTTIEVTPMADKSGAVYLKFEHPASGYAVCGAAAIVQLNGDGTCKNAQLCFNGVTAVSFNATAITATLQGKLLSDEAIDQAVDANLSIEDPMQDIHASGQYRIQLAKVYAKRALKLARDRAV